MITGRLQEKNDYYYLVLQIPNQYGKKVPKWISTGLKTKGNKKRAEALLVETKAEYQEMIANRPKLDSTRPGAASKPNPLFADFILNWVEGRKKSLQPNTFSSYKGTIKSRIAPYFKDIGVRLQDLTKDHISDYYEYLMEELGNGANSVKHHHVYIRMALDSAFRDDVILGNPADKVELPKAEEVFHGDFYDADEINTLIEVSRGSRLLLAILVAAFYGLRRSEVLGLRWKSINFKNDTIEVSHVITEYVDENGNRVRKGKDRTKNRTSRRVLPLMPQVKSALLDWKEQQNLHKSLCGKDYCKDYQGYVFVGELGSLLKPNYISQGFKTHLEKHDLRHIRFHDLRHSCASLLLANGIDLKRIQEWMGHASIETTSKYYGHLKYESKLESANVINDCLKTA